jgi:Flp pilus assembly pilin Flp
MKLSLHLSRVILSVLRSQDGVASMEYALLAVGILTGLATAIGAASGALDTLFSGTIVGLL